MPNNDTDTFCSNVKYLRTKHGFSKKKVACLMRISVSTLNQIETGVLPPRLDCVVLAHLSQHFHIPMHRLFVPLEEG